MEQYGEELFLSKSHGTPDLNAAPTQPELEGSPLTARDYRRGSRRDSRIPDGQSDGFESPDSMLLAAAHNSGALFAKDPDARWGGGA